MLDELLDSDSSDLDTEDVMLLEVLNRNNVEKCELKSFYTY